MELQKKGAGSLLNLLHPRTPELNSLGRSRTRNSLVETKQSLDSAVADREAFVQQWSSQLSQELVKGRGGLDSANLNTKGAQAPGSCPAHCLRTFRGVDDGQGFGGIGAHIGHDFFTLMPLNAPVEAEAHFLTRDVGFIRTGDPCIIKVDLFNFVAHGTAEGKVRWISEGAFTTDDNNQPTEPYYKVRCSIDKMNFYDVPANFRLVPG